MHTRLVVDVMLWAGRLLLDAVGADFFDTGRSVVGHCTSVCPLSSVVTVSVTWKL